MLTWTHPRLMETKELIWVASGIADQSSKARMAIAYETVN